LKYIADARWVDLAPLMVQALAVERLEKSGMFSSVAARGSGINGDYVLKGDIRQFAAVRQGDATKVRIDIFMRLVSRDDQRKVVAKDFDVLVTVAGSGIKPIVAAFDTALAQVLGDVAVWTAENVEKK
jgi:cholesterol transport system auxiliary component